MEINISKIKSYPYDFIDDEGNQISEYGDNFRKCYEDYGLENAVEDFSESNVYGSIYKLAMNRFEATPIKAVYLKNSSSPTISEVFKYRKGYEIASGEMKLNGYAILCIDENTGELVSEARGSVGVETSDDPRITFPEIGNFTLYYIANHIYHPGGETPSVQYGILAKYDIAVVSNAAPKTDLTITSVVNSILETAEPIRKGETPRYVFADAEKYQNTSCAEFNFANGMTLREILEEIAGSVNAIPRLKNGAIYFEELGRNEEVNKQYLGTPISSTHIATVEKYASHLDSVVNGLMNMDNEQQGAIADPMLGGFKTLRSDVTQTDMRITVDSAIIKTSGPIEKPTKLTMKLGDDGTEYDITPYLYEKKEYDLLFSNNGAYPYSKAYALYYVQGQPNIYGLNYKEEDAVNQCFRNFAIENIYESASGNSVSWKSDYLSMMFNVEYVTSINGRVRQCKVNTSDLTTPSAMAYNQSANKLSSVNFGNRLRGETAMCGTSEKKLVFKTLGIKTLMGCVGKRYRDKDGTSYYIGACTFKIWKDYIIAELTLTENFNQLGRYVGINNAFRQFEIDTNVQDRYIVYEDYIVLGSGSDSGSGCDRNKYPNNSLDIGGVIIKSVTDTLNRQDVQKKVSLVKATTSDDENEILSALLPVQSLALGNSLIFNFKYDDNYSAGEFATDIGKEYKLTRLARYGDAIYGEAKYLGFDLLCNIEAKDSVAFGDSLPRADLFGDVTNTGGGDPRRAASTGEKPIVVHKSSRDAINMTYQVHFVTNDGLIIGEHLTQLNDLVSNKGGVRRNAPILYFLKKPINEITGLNVTWENHRDIIAYSMGLDPGDDQDPNVELTKVQHSDNASLYLQLSKFHRSSHGQYVAWAICTPDGKFLLGKNTNQIDDVYVYATHNIKE